MSPELRLVAYLLLSQLSPLQQFQSYPLAEPQPAQTLGQLVPQKR